LYSNLESQVQVLLALSKVEAAESAGFRSVVSCVPGPQMVSYQRNVALCAHSLRAESTAGPLVRCFVEEIVSKNTLVLLETSSFQVILHCSEVDVVFNLNSIMD
jgi:hypothetical protein